MRVPCTTVLDILSNIIEDSQPEAEPNPELKKAKEAIRGLKTQLRQTEQRADESELRFWAAGDIFVRLMEGPHNRVLAAMEHTSRRSRLRQWRSSPKRHPVMLRKSKTARTVRAKTRAADAAAPAEPVKDQ